MKSHFLIFLATAFVLFGSFALDASSDTKTVSLSVAEGLNSRRADVLATDSFGRLWAGTSRGFNIISNGYVSSFESLRIGSDNYSLGRTLCIACSSRILLATETCLFDLDPVTQSAELVCDQERNPVSTSFVLCDGDDMLFFDKGSKSLCSYSLQTRKLTVLYALTGSVPYDFVKILKISEGIYIFSDVTKGLFIFDRERSSFTPCAEDLGRILPSSVIVSGGRIWTILKNGDIAGRTLADSDIEPVAFSKDFFCTEGASPNSLTEVSPGVFLVSIGGGKSVILDTDAGEVSELPDECPTDALCAIVSGESYIFGTEYSGIVSCRKSFGRVLEAPVCISSWQSPDRSLWVGTAGMGLARFDEGSGTFTRIAATEGMTITSICQLDKNDLLVTAGNRGLYSVNTKTGQVRRSDLFDCDNSILASNPSGDILCFNGTLGHSILRSSSKQLQSFSLPYVGARIDNVVALPSYAIISAGGSIFELDYNTLNTRTIYSASDSPRADFTAVCGNGRIWYSSEDNVFLYDPRTNDTTLRIKASDIGDVFAMASDSSDNVWITASDGLLVRCDLEGKLSFFHRQEAAGNGAFLSGLALGSTSGQVYFPVVDGLLAFDSTDELTDDGISDTISCVSVYSGGQRRKYSPESGVASVPDNFGSISVNVALASEDMIEKVPVYYTLSSGDEIVFSTITSDASLDLPSLEQGEYSLDARLLGRNGWSEPVRMLSIVVRKPFFMSMWMCLVFVILLSLIYFLATKLSVRQKRSFANLYSAAGNEPETAAQMVFNVSNAEVDHWMASHDNANEVDFDTSNLTILIADSDRELLRSLKEAFDPLFKSVLTAVNGKESLDIALSRKPDVILSGVMMPLYNGFEVCKTVKSDEELRSIPFLFLSSLKAAEYQSTAFNLGADAFLFKPFAASSLHNVIKGTLRSRNDVKLKYTSCLMPAVSENVTYNTADEQFVIKLNDFIKSKISDPDLGVDMIVDHMCVSRTTLFNKMNSLVGTSAVKYIRRLRIDTAKELLSNTEKSIGEIAAETGFAESQYFSTVFKQETGVAPSSFRR